MIEAAGTKVIEISPNLVADPNLWALDGAHNSCREIDRAAEHIAFI